MIRVRRPTVPSKVISMIPCSLLLSFVFSASVDLCALSNIFILSNCASGHTLIRAIGVLYSLVSAESYHFQEDGTAGHPFRFCHLWDCCRCDTNNYLPSELSSATCCSNFQTLFLCLLNLDLLVDASNNI